MRLGVIPARGGSKRIPGKNIRRFCGKPMIAWSIEAARNSGVIDRLLVSTDDEEVARVAREYGAETPFLRPAELADDFTPTVPVVKHAVSWAVASWGPVEHVCCLYATAPFARSEDMAIAYQRLVGEVVTGYVFAATDFGFPIQRAFRIKAGGFCEMFAPENYNVRSQDLEPAYQDAGQFYWGRADAFLQDKRFMSDDSKPLVLPRHRVQDIDTLDDWERAELMWRLLNPEAVSSR